MNQKSGLSYCPICIKEDIIKYREAYFHRIHQMPYILTCPTHGCFLEEYIVKLFTKNINNLFKMDCENLNFTPLFESDPNVARKFQLVGTNAIKILESDRILNLNLVNLNYFSFLKERGFIRGNGQIKKAYLLREFTEFYGHRFFEKMHFGEGNIIYWLRNIGQMKKTLHPIAHLLLILFLSDSVESFFNYKSDEAQIVRNNKRKSKKQNDFAQSDSGPWVCLNPVADHYKQFVVDKCHVTFGREGIPIRTFYCTCGYSYIRRGSNQSWEENFRKDKVRTFGAVWEQKLIEVMGQKKVSSNNVAKIMGCSNSTIVSYAKKLGIFEEQHPSNSKSYKNINRVLSEKNIEQKIDEKRQVVLKYIKDNPSMRRSHIKGSLIAECAFLLRHDKEWINNVLPPAKGTLPMGKSMETFYVEHDETYYGLIVQTYDDIINSNKLKRITKTSLLNKLHKDRLTILNLLDKLPRTSNLLVILPESWERFRIRRIELLVRRLIDDGIAITKNIIIRDAHIKKRFITPGIEEYIENILSKL